MTQVLRLAEIQAAVADADLVKEMEIGFVAYSKGQVIVPPVGELLFENPPGDAHIKYGHIKGDDIFVVKVASGFYNNPDLGLSSNSGLILVFSAKTGFPEAVLLDEGQLTNLRTAAAGAVAAKWLAPKEVKRIGVLGSGVQARMQLSMLKKVTSCREVTAWARSAEKAQAYAKDMTRDGFTVTVAKTPQEVAAACNLIVTATLTSKPLLQGTDIQPGTHITAMGSDTPEKCELAPEILGKANQVICDSIPQCRERGEVYHAIKANKISVDKLVELGSVIDGKAAGRRSQNDITVCDLTGVAVQDIRIARVAMRK
jgi:ornithine cyclodeaminase